MRTVAVIAAGEGRQSNLQQALDCVLTQDTPLDLIVVVGDGWGPDYERQGRVVTVRVPKHEPGMEQPRNAGVRIALEEDPDLTHAWFLDSDIITEPDCYRMITVSYGATVGSRVMACPYDWMREGHRKPMPELRNDPRWPMFDKSPAGLVYEGDLSAGLACFGGNLVWPIDEFVRVGGFHPDLHMGRCEDGELGLRAVAMGVGISFAAYARGWHLWHPRNDRLAAERNRRDVPLINQWHPWVQGEDVFMVDRDGKAFDRRCLGCGELIPTIGWWEHGVSCA